MKECAFLPVRWYNASVHQFVLQPPHLTAEPESRPMQVIQGRKGGWQAVACCCALFYLALTLAGSWHWHHPEPSCCGAGCPAHCGPADSDSHQAGHDHPHPHLAGIPSHQENGACHLCSWTSSARVRQETVTLVVKPLAFVEFRSAGAGIFAPSPGYYPLHTRAPPVADGRLS